MLDVDSGQGMGAAVGLRLPGRSVEGIVDGVDGVARPHQRVQMLSGPDRR